MRPFPHRRHASKTIEDDGPLAQLQRRFIYGAVASTGAFATAFLTDLVRDTPSDDMLISGVERAAGCVWMLCGVATTMLWVLTKNTELALAIWKAAIHSSTPSDQAVVDVGERIVPTQRVSAQPIPISRGAEIRRNGHDRHAV